MLARISRCLPRSRRGRLLALFLIVLVSSAGLWGKWGLVSWRLRSARHALAEGRIDDALTQLVSAESLQPDRPELLFLLARANRRANHLQSALEYLNRAEKAGWSADEIRQQRSLLLVQSGQFGRAERFLETALRRGVDDQLAEEIYEALAKGYLKTYRLGDALFCLKYWIEWKPQEVGPRLMLADIKERVEDWKGAVAAYRSVLKIDPSLSEPNRRLADNLLMLQDVDGARRCYSRALELAPEDISAQIGRAKCDRRLARTKAATRQFEQLLKGDLSARQRVEVLIELAQILLRDERKPKDAIDLLLEAEKLAPHNHRVNAALAVAYRKIGNSGLARIHDEKSAAGLRRLNRLTEVTRLLVQSPKDAGLRYEAGMIFMEQGMKRAGAEWLTTVLMFDPHHRGAHRALAEYYEEAGDREAACRHRKLAGPSP